MSPALDAILNHMPNRYTLHTTGDLKDTFALTLGTPAGTKPSYNISPVQTVPVILQKDGQRVAERMLWGFLPENAKDTNSIFRYKTHHAKSGDVFRKPTWRGAITSQRCLIPANGFYEWRQAPEGKRAFYLTVVDRPLFAFAGIYSSWTNPDGETQGVCAIITTSSDAQTDQIPSTLPVIVDPADEDTWLDPTMNDMSTLIKIMRPLEPEQLKVTRVGDAVNSVKAKSSPKLIEKLQRSV